MTQKTLTGAVLRRKRKQIYNNDREWESLSKKIYENKQIINMIKFLLIILLVISLGLLAINQTLQYFYKAQFLKSPCSLCKELNPGYGEPNMPTLPANIIMPTLPANIIIDLERLS